MALIQRRSKADSQDGGHCVCAVDEGASSVEMESWKLHLVTGE